MRKVTISIHLMRARSEALVIALVGKDFAPKWWSSPNKAFGMNTPDERFKEYPEEVYNYLMFQGYGP